jgi:hypothetical protein
VMILSFGKVVQIIALTVMKATMAALKEFNGKQPCMGNIYIIMRALLHHMAALCNAPFNIPSDLVEPLKVVLKNREALVASDLHYVGALLNPHLIKDMELYDDQNATAGLMRVFQRLTDTAEEFQAVKVEFNLYFHTMSPYCREHQVFFSIHTTLKIWNFMMTKMRWQDL